jgi:transposase InsO family protein
VKRLSPGPIRSVTISSCLLASNPRKSSQDAQPFENSPASNHLHYLIHGTLRLDKFRIPVSALWDTGASGYAFMDLAFARRHDLALVALKYPLPVFGFDGTPSGQGPITHIVFITLDLQGHVEKSMPLYVTQLREHPIILGLPWSKLHQPHPDWEKDNLIFASSYCLQNCTPSPIRATAAPRRFGTKPRPQKESQPRITLPPTPPDSRSGSPVQGTLPPTPPDSQSSSPAQVRSPTPVTETTEPSRVLEAKKSGISPKIRYRSPSSRRTSTERRAAQASRPQVRVDCAMVGAASFANLVQDPENQAFECSLRDLDRALEKHDDKKPQPSVPAELAQPYRVPYVPDRRLSPAENQQRQNVHRMRQELRLAVSVSPEDLEKYRKSKEVDPALLLPVQYHEFLSVFDRKESYELPPHRAYDHAIELHEGKEPPYGPLYSMSREENEELRKELESQLSKGFIRASRSPAASPVLFVKKAGGGLRFCVDYRGLNEITVKNRYPLPLITETLARLSSAKIYTKLDIISAFNRLRIKEGDEWKTAFRTRFGLFEYLVMPFGLCNGPASFQHYINDTLREYLDVFCTAYLDDILIYSECPAEHEIHVKRILAKLHDAGLQVDITKCEFHVQRVSYLGLIVTTQGIKMDPQKVATIAQWPKIENVKDIQSFLGFANFYRRFIYGFSKLAAPLTALTKKDKPFKWTPECEKAFESLKAAFTSDAVLLHYDPEKEIIVETDASDFVSGGILSQHDESGVLRPVAYFSKKHTPAECNYEIYDKELMAIVRAFEEWRPELEGAAFPIKVITDHKNLEYFTTSKALSRRQARWSEFLSRFNFKITYRPGKQSAKPDALTRRSGDLPKGGGDERFRYQNRVVLKPENLSPEVQADLVRTFPDQSPAYVLDLSLGTPPEVVPIHLKSTLVCPLRLHMSYRDPGYHYLGPATPEEADDSQTETGSEGTITDDHEPLPDQDPNDQEALPTEELWNRALAKDQFEERILRLLRNGVRYCRQVQLADCSEVDGHLCFRGRRYVPRYHPLRLRLFKLVHDSVPGGHPGRNKTLSLFYRTFWWPTIYRDSKRYVRNCDVCCRSKHSRQSYQGWLRSLPIPERRWRDVSLDYIGPLRPSTFQGVTYRYVLVLVDRLSKMRHLEPAQTMEAAEAAQIFFRSAWKLHGTPETLVSDRGTQFISELWKTLCQRLRIDAKLSTAYHPETDGQTENANGVMNQYLRAYVNYMADDWAEYLPGAEFAANNATSSSTNVSPFLANSGQHPRVGYEPLEPRTALTARARREIVKADELVTKMERLTEHLREEMLIAQAVSETQTNAYRRPARTYKEGDLVWLNARNIKRARPAEKLDDINLGPFRVSRVTRNPLVVCLDLPPEMRIYPNFHVSLLLPTADDPLPGQRIEPREPVIATDGQVQWLVEAIVDSKFDHRHRPPLLLYRVHWEDGSYSWEPWSCVAGAQDALDLFHLQYPDKPGPQHET